MAAHDDILWKQAMMWCVGLFVLAQLSATQSISTPEKKVFEQSINMLSELAFVLWLTEDIPSSIR
jgi:hypothetical protein